MSHYGNEYYILVGFCVKKACDHFDFVCLFASPNSHGNFKFIVSWQIGRNPKDIPAT